MRLTYPELIAVALLALPPLAFPQANPHSVPVVDAQLGPCSADLTVKDTNGKPVYNSKIDVRVAYGHFHRMDLEVSTNLDGKARFAGIPTNTRRGLLYQAAEGDRSGNAFQDPAAKCNAQFTIVLRKNNQTYRSRSIACRFNPAQARVHTR
jgi:hypothetical protein